MSESRKFPMLVLSYVIFAALGLALTAVCLAGAAQWMAAQGRSGAAAVPLATAAVCVGSLLSAFAAAVWKRQHGLLTGLAQSAPLAIALSVAAMLNGTSAEPVLLIRVLAVLLCGSVGGVLGMALRARSALRNA